MNNSAEVTQDNFRSGFVAIIGKPNVGKSTLMNRLIGEKLSIISAKPQTTRLAIKGIFTDEHRQIIFLDTPGYLKPRYEMQKRMIKQLQDSLKDADAILFITEANTFPTEYDEELLKILGGIPLPKLALVNKIDLNKGFNPDLLSKKTQVDFAKVLLVSAIQGDNLDLVIPEISALLPLGPMFYDKEQLSDLPLRFFAQETIREGIFNQYEQEIPYATAVLIDKFEELPAKVIIHATIWIERDSQKPILIGKRGEGLRKIREYAERRLTMFLSQPTQVHLWVKVKKNWRKSSFALKQIGLKDENG